MLKKEYIFMGTLFCKIHCPFMCFCTPSIAHLYSSGPSRLENTRHVVHSTEQTHAVCYSSLNGTCGLKEEGRWTNGKPVSEGVLKSCVKRVPYVCKKRVQWMDRVGKQLAETKEFEPSETGDTDGEDESSSSHCICVIL